MESETQSHHSASNPKPGSSFGFSSKTLVVLLFALLYCTSFYYASKTFFKDTFDKDFQADNYLPSSGFNAEGYPPLVPWLLSLVGNDVLLLISIFTVVNLMLLYYLTGTSWSVLLYALGGIIAHTSLLGSGLLAQTVVNSEILLLLATAGSPLRFLVLPLAFLTHKFGFYLVGGITLLTLLPRHGHLIALPLWIKNTLDIPQYYAVKFTFTSFGLFPLAPLVPFVIASAPILIQQTLLLTLIGTLVTYGFNNRAFFTVIPLMILVLAPAIKQNKKQENWVLIALVIWYAIGVLVFLTRLGARGLELG